MSYNTYQYTPNTQLIDSYNNSFPLNQNFIAQAEKYIPSNLFQTIYNALPNVFAKESYQTPFTEQGAEFNCEYQFTGNNIPCSTQQNSVPDQYFTTSEDTASEPENSSEEQTKKKGKNKVSLSVKKNWTQEEEDELILSLGLKYKNDWKRVAKQILKIRGRKLGPKKLKDHFKSLTKGSLPKRIKFTHEEDLQIAKYFEQFGADWGKIATFLPARSAMMIKNRFYSYIRKKNIVSDLLNELSHSDNQNLEDEECLNSSILKEEDEADLEESEAQTQFISYNQPKQNESAIKIIEKQNSSGEEFFLGEEAAIEGRETFFSDFDDDCFFLFEQSFKQSCF